MSATRSEENVQTKSTEVKEAAVDLVDLEDGDEETTDEEVYVDKKAMSAKDTSVRRRIEEQLEVRMLRDELGMDDFDI
jgi:hypothetical protein